MQFSYLLELSLHDPAAFFVIKEGVLLDFSSICGEITTNDVL